MFAKHQVENWSSPVLRGHVPPIDLSIYISEIPELTLKRQIFGAFALTHFPSFSGKTVIGTPKIFSAIEFMFVC